MPKVVKRNRNHRNKESFGYPSRTPNRIGNLRCTAQMLGGSVATIQRLHPILDTLFQIFKSVFPIQEDGIQGKGEGKAPRTVK